jgi:hypothetical protein
VEAKGIVVTGKFTEGDWADLCEMLRMIERRHPEETYKIMAVDPNASMEEMAEVLRWTFPKLPGQEPVIQTIKHTDEKVNNGNP